jgi:hypothetical protein
MIPRSRRASTSILTCMLVPRISGMMCRGLSLGMPRTIDVTALFIVHDMRRPPRMSRRGCLGRRHLILGVRRATCRQHSSVLRSGGMRVIVAAANNAARLALTARTSWRLKASTSSTCVHAVTRL